MAKNIKAMYNITKSTFENLKINDLEVKKRMDIDNKTFVYCVSEKQSISGELEKGFNGKYKINRISSGPNIFEYRIIETNLGKYFVILGKNFDIKISQVAASIDNKEYKIKIPKEEFFIIYCSLPKKTISRFPEEFKIYDDYNVEITLETMYKRYDH